MFITFEGIEGCGKTTQIDRLVKRLREYGIPLTITLEPGGTKIGKSIRQILLDAKNTNLSPLAELMLYIADRAQHVEEVIKPALEEGNWVISDRFFDTTVSYQGAARGLDMELIKMLNTKATQGIQPDVTFLLDCPADLGLDRTSNRPSDGQDRFEREDLNFHEKVRMGYLELARSTLDVHLSQAQRSGIGRFVVIDATQTEDEVEETIFEYLALTEG